MKTPDHSDDYEDDVKHPNRGIHRGWPLACCLLLAGFAHAQGPSDLAGYLRWAEAHQPRLEAVRGLTETMRHEADAAGALPDLKLAWGEMLVPVETRVGPQQRVLSLSQSLPWFGSLGEAEAAAGLRVDAAMARLTAERLDVRRGVYRAWFELARLQRERDLVLGKLGLLEQEEAATTAAYEVGNAPYALLVRLQMSRQRLQTRLLSLQDAMGPAVAELATAAGLPVDAGGVPLADLPAPPAAFPEESELLMNMHARHPGLEGLRLEEESFGREVQAARLRGKPGFTVGLDYIMTGDTAMPGVEDNGKDPVIARIAVSLPLWSGKSEAKRQASAGRRETASAQRRRMELELDEQLQRTLFRVRDARRQLDLLNDELLPSARQLEAAARADYESGRAGYEGLLAAGRDILDLETEILRHQAELALALVDLDILQGGEGDAFLTFPGEEQ